MKMRLSLQSESSIINQFQEYFNDVRNQNVKNQNDLTQSTANIFKKSNKQLKGKELTEIALETKFSTYFSGKNLLKRSNSRFFTAKEIKRIKDSTDLQELGVFSKPEEQHLTIRKLPNITEEQYYQRQNSITSNETLIALYNYIKKVNCNFKDADCGTSIGGISPLTYLVEVFFLANKEKKKEMNKFYDLLKPYINNYRTIYGDGNCFYRAVMFRYLEILILNKNIEILRKVVYDVTESFNSEELKKRRIINKSDIKPDLTFKILFLLVYLLKYDMVAEAHEILIRSFSTCQKFDYAMILYFRYILYDYIKKNENKIYLKSFPVKLGNLLPNQYERENGDFLFNEFYEQDLLKFYTYTEKIVIYITPFVLGIKLNVIVCEINDSAILQQFGWEGESEIKTNDEISVLNNKNHYEVIYTKDDEEKNKKYFIEYENDIKPMVLVKEKEMIYTTPKAPKDNKNQNQNIQKQSPVQYSANNANNANNQNISPIQKNNCVQNNICNNNNNNVNNNNSNKNNNNNSTNNKNIKNNNNTNNTVNPINNNKINNNTLKGSKNKIMNDMRPNTTIIKKKNNTLMNNNNQNTNENMTVVGSCKKCSKEIISSNKKQSNCQNCYRQKIFNFCLNYYQKDDKNPIEALEKNAMLNKSIIEYNNDYKEKLDKSTIIDRIKSKECFLKEDDKNNSNGRLLPCGCILCSHFIEYFKIFTFNRRFICICQKKYTRIDMLRLGVILYEKQPSISKKCSDYFQKRLILNCCICDEKLNGNNKNTRFVKCISNNYLCLNETSLNIFIKTFSHYFCDKCNSSIQRNKEFECKICGVRHLI